ncbi:negative elongation factor D [Saccoglossus kowalevskii]|uniref:Negative elongation factor D n=1 Tax=Saccoglossus kowalevskii TaxID=10224 RepID=A0ABM0GXJ0_SACKO|nr:PREDICTED: negative elongation factor D [Saccoglossus kowalevskii]
MDDELYGEYNEYSNWDDENEVSGSYLDEQDQEQNDALIQQECLDNFSSKDYIMEPGVFKDLQRYFRAGGAPEQVVELLSDNYTAVAQTVNLFAEWLISTGVNAVEVQQMVEKHLKTLIVKHFDPKKADSIFSDEGETPSWLENMIQHQTWRSLFYKLAEQYPDCLMLNFTIKIISDAGYQGEIANISTACHQVEIFSRVLRTSVVKLLEGAEEFDKQLPEFTKMVCHGEHTYLYCQALLQILGIDPQAGSVIRRISEEVQKSASEKGYDVDSLSLSLTNAAAYPRACQAIASMLSRHALNPADITVLFKMYSSPDPPPVELIRIPQLLIIFIHSLFKPGAKVNPEHRSKYVYVLAYAVCVHESWQQGRRLSINKDELKATSQAIERVHHLCCNESKGAQELTAEIQVLYQCIRYPIVAVGVLFWVKQTVADPGYFQRMTDHTPLHLALLDEVSNCHPLHHDTVLQLLKDLFEKIYPDLDVLLELELKKTVLDRMVHLLSRGYVVYVVQYIKKCVEKQDTDISLIRHFVTEVLDMIAPPYTSEFVQLFLPIIENEDITGTLRSEDGKDPVSEFIVHCKTNFIMMN